MLLVDLPKADEEREQCRLIWCEGHVRKRVEQIQAPFRRLVDPKEVVKRRFPFSFLQNNHQNHEHPIKELIRHDVRARSSSMGL